jgi:hypothetical protein
MRPGHRAPATWLAGAALAVVALAELAGGCHRNKLLPRADGAAVVVVSTPDAGIDPGLPATNEVEPNGTLANAQKIDLGLSHALVVNGSITAGADPGAKGKDVDLYRLIIPEEAPPPAGSTAAGDGAPAAPGTGADAARPTTKRRLTAIVHPDLGLPVTVDALDDAGQLLIAAPGSEPGEAEGIPSMVVTPGTYFLRVRAAKAGTEGSYHLTLRLQPLEPGEELEPDGKATLATEMAPNGEAVGYFGWRHDQDWYRVPLDGLPDGSLLSADLEAVPGVTASIQILDSVERKLTEVRGRKEERVPVRNIRLAPGEHNIFLVVRADVGRNLDVRYNLRVRTEVGKPGAAGGDLEPNDDARHASALADGTVQGYLGRGDVDVYRYTAAEPLELDIEAAPPERVDVRMEIIRELDNALVVRVDEGRRQEPERLPNLFVPAGSILIRLSAGKGDGNPDEPYRLTVASHRPEVGAEREPNNTSATATPLPAGASGNGLLYPKGDVDFWQAPLPSDGAGEVAVTVTGVAGMALDVRALTLASREVGRFKINGDAPVTNRLAIGAEPCCLLQVREATGKASNFRDRYTVTVGR